MVEQMNVRLVGKAPFIMHNGSLSDPFYYYAKQLKKLTSSRKKTDETFERIAKLEWFGSLYLDSKKRIIVPSSYVENCLINGAKKKKLGVHFKAGMYIEDDSILNYNGPENIEELWDNKDFVFQTMVNVNSGKVKRTRPIFREWSIDVIINYLSDVLDSETIKDALVTAGMLCGIGDWRPKYGRFSVDS